MSEKALVNARNELKQLGLIDFITSKKRGECTQYHVFNTAKDSTKEVQKEYKGSRKEVQSMDINKQKLKPKVSQKSVAPAHISRKENGTNKFNQFPQREYSSEEYLEMERRLLSGTKDVVEEEKQLLATVARSS